MVIRNRENKLERGLENLARACINSDRETGFGCYGVGGTRGAAQRLARDSFPPPAGGNIPPCI
jgi:hypothetical protein